MFICLLLLCILLLFNMFYLICMLIIYNLLRDVLSFLIGLSRVLMAAAILFVYVFWPVSLVTTSLSSQIIILSSL